jgi:hypothetical protein
MAKIRVGKYAVVSRFVTRYDFSFEQDTGQVSEIRYIKQGRKKGVYRGKIVNAVTGIVTITNLDTDWVERNFYPPFLNVVKSKHKNVRRSFVTVPVGAPRRVNKFDKCLANLACTDRFPNLFQQNGRDTCVTSGLANALHFMGWTTQALEIEKFGDEYVKKINIHFN